MNCHFMVNVAPGNNVSVFVPDSSSGLSGSNLPSAPSPILASKFQYLIRDRLALRRLPDILQWPEQAEEGGLMGYGPRLSAVFDQSARQVARLLRGAKVADVPVEQPIKFELVINLKTAKMLGVEIPPIVLSRADRTIE